MKLGTILSIQIAANAGGRLAKVQEVKAIAGMGLEGDRYYARTGTYSKAHDESREATFIEAEALEALTRDYQVALTGAESRRNITTRGVALNHLVGKEFQAGDAVFRGIRLCEPCTHMEEVSGKQARKGLIHRGGLRAQIVKSGKLCVGDEIAADEDEAP
jgi:MOSC domain-containing protein YiiM